jgi:hypothetical protein
MEIKAGSSKYAWREHWARIPDTETGRSNGRTHGVVVTRSGDMIVFCQAQPAVVRHSADGRLINAWGDRFRGAHGMTLVEEDGVEYLWLTDQHSAEVVKTTLDGRTCMNINKPDVAYPRGAAFVPTWVAVNEERFGGNGDIWVADGYGSSLVHRFNKHGKYLSSINGTEGSAGQFKCPHAIAFDHRAGAEALYITDRANRQIQVYDREGKFLRAFGADFLTHPCAFAFDPRNGQVVIPDLFGRITIVDKNDRFIAHLGENAGIEKQPGWPNLPADQVVAGKFNSPHSAAVAANGDIFVVEWIVGGRIIKLEDLGHRA